MNGTAVLAVLAVLLLGATAEAASFVRTDIDRDGVVTPDEARRTLRGLGSAHFDKCDKNGDGGLGRQEFACLDALDAMLGLED